MNFAPLVWSKTWNKAVKGYDVKPLKVLKKCEALVFYNNNDGAYGLEAQWLSLPDMSTPRCGHAMVMTYLKSPIYPPGTSHPVWLPQIFVIGGCQGASPEAPDGLECWPPNRALVYSDDVAGTQLNTVEMLQLNFPDPLPSSSNAWKPMPSMNKKRGGANNFSAVVLGDYIYVFGGRVPPQGGKAVSTDWRTFPDGGWDAERWEWTSSTGKYAPAWEPVTTLPVPKTIFRPRRVYTPPHLASTSAAYCCGGTVVHLRSWEKAGKRGQPWVSSAPEDLGLCIVGSGMSLAEGLQMPALPPTPPASWSPSTPGPWASSWWEWMQFCSPGGPVPPPGGDCTFYYPYEFISGEGAGPAPPCTTETGTPCLEGNGCNTCPRDNGTMLIGGPGPRTSEWSTRGMAITPIGAFAATLCCHDSEGKCQPWYCSDPQPAAKATPNLCIFDIDNTLSRGMNNSSWKDCNRYCKPETGGNSCDCSGTDVLGACPAVYGRAAYTGCLGQGYNVGIATAEGSPRRRVIVRGCKSR